MGRRVSSKSCMNNLELQSLHYWFKNAPLQNPTYKYNNILNIMQDTKYKSDILDVIGIDTQQFANFIQKSRINLHQRVILRNVFEHWKLYVVHKLHARRATYKANYFYHRKLKKKVLNALSKNVLLKWEHIVSLMNNCAKNKSVISVNDVKAEKHYRKVLLKRYFEYWCNYISIINKKKEHAQRITIYYNLHCLKRYIKNWKIYVMLQREKKIMQEKVDEARTFYTKNILRKFIRVWINVCEFTLNRNKMELAIKHYESKLLIKQFSSWKMFHNYKKEKLNIAQRISAHNRERLLKRYFGHFIMCVKESIAEKVANEDAEIFYNFKLVQKVFLAWLEWYNKKVEDAAKVCELRSLLENRQKRKILITWRLYVIQKKCNKRKTFTARSFYEKKLASKVVKKFRNYASYRKEKRDELSYINDKSEEITKQLQIIYINKWRKALYWVMQEKQKLNQAIQFSQFNLSRKYFAHWKEFSRRYKIKLVHKEKLNNVATDFALKKFILHWHAKLQDVLVIRKKEIVIISTMEHKIKKKYFLYWKEYIAEKRKMTNDIKVAIELYNKFLLREGLKEILRNSLRINDYQRDMQLEIAAMQSFKNIEIQKVYFDKWYSLVYVKNKSGRAGKIVDSNVYQIKQTPFDSFNTCLVLPEYMMERNRVAVSHDSFPRDWSFHLFKPF